MKKVGKLYMCVLLVCFPQRKIPILLVRCHLQTIKTTWIWLIFSKQVVFDLLVNSENFDNQRQLNGKTKSKQGSWQCCNRLLLTQSILHQNCQIYLDLIFFKIALSGWKTHYLIDQIIFVLRRSAKFRTFWFSYTTTPISQMCVVFSLKII